MLYILAGKSQCTTGSVMKRKRCFAIAAEKANCTTTIFNILRVGTLILVPGPYSRNNVGRKGNYDALLLQPYKPNQRSNEKENDDLEASELGLS